MILLDGKKLAEKILDEVKKDVAGLDEKPRLAIVLVGKNTAIEKFIEQKKKAAKSVGIDVCIYPFDQAISTNELRKRLSEIVHEKKNTGVIVQLPLPEQIHVQYILNAITPEKDVDVLSSRAIGNFSTGRSKIMPPVAGAIKALFEEYGIDYKNKHVVILGAGNLVGKPTALWLLNEKATFSVIRSSTRHPEEFLQQADIIISGIGKPGFITGNMIKDGAVLIDAGTSESEGPSTGLGVKKLVGDVDFESVAAKCSFLTPVPGGVGPLTVALLFKNLVAISPHEYP
ncbi:MAG: bifunctional 5,10-methylenetetrahydrofolate dehydrogenase/5,10-methenyltetrahydrofolate cyclohydrolase [Candidatus Sungbacteria bacterium]|nr:bifunctional 5,10-methylenetetrahydrofolate dehydrogenase/5,10-methenyltetrahydrofolate cyclohydrolase [Candidatus Sungbacteria bacterium]